MVNCDISQQKVAEILGITPAAVSQYMRGKRGYAVDFDEEVVKELQEYAKKICRGEIKDISPILCDICKKVWTEKTLSQIEVMFDEEVEMCSLCDRLG
ncbi:MAG: helix-turn-helix domain-containing protein [Thermoplasmata archaeon]